MFPIIETEMVTESEWLLQAVERPIGHHTARCQATLSFLRNVTMGAVLKQKGWAVSIAQHGPLPTCLHGTI